MQHRKAAWRRSTRAFSQELSAKKVRINCVAPGPVDTPMLRNNPNIKSGAEKISGDVAQPSELASAILFSGIGRSELYTWHDARRRWRQADKPVLTRRVTARHPAASLCVEIGHRRLLLFFGRLQQSMLGHRAGNAAAGRSVAARPGVVATLCRFFLLTVTAVRK